VGPQRCQAVDHQRRRVGVPHRDRGDELRLANASCPLRGGEVRRRWVLRGAGEEAWHQGQPHRAVYLEDHRIPADRVNGAEGAGFETAMPTRDHTRVTIAAQAVGVAQGALDYALLYALERRQFGKPIADFQGSAVPARPARRHRHEDRGRLSADLVPPPGTPSAATPSWPSPRRGDVLPLRRRDRGLHNAVRVLGRYGLPVVLCLEVAAGPDPQRSHPTDET